MRKKIPQQRRLTPYFHSHEHSQELKTCSELLDQKPEIMELVYQDLTAGVKNPKLGRKAIATSVPKRLLECAEKVGIEIVVIVVK